MAENCGLAAVALHARTREMGYSGQARWEWIAAIKDAVKIPVIGNGDIRSPEDACAMVAQTGCDAVMIGRTAPSNPWIFRQIEQYCAGMQDAGASDAGTDNAHVGKACVGPGLGPGQAEQSSAALADSTSTADIRLTREGHDFSRAVSVDNLKQALAAEGRFYDSPTEADRYQMIRIYFQMLIEEELPDAVGKMKQFASWFTHGVPGGAALRKEIYESKSAPEILARVEEFFESRLCGAGALARES